MKDKLSNVHVLIVFILVAANVFSLPLGVSISVNILALFITGSCFTISTANNKENRIIYQVLLLLVYTFFVCLINMYFSLYTLGKPLRLFIVILIFNILSRKVSMYRNKEIIIGIILAFILHLLCVYLQFFVPVTKMVFYLFLRTEDNIAITEDSLRAFGLDGSFDGAGLNLCFLIVLLWFIYKKEKKIYVFILILATLLGCFMVGRTAMLIGSISVIIMLVSLLKENKIYFIVSIIIAVISIFYLYDIFLYYFENNDVNSSYRKETVTYLTTKSMLFLPGSTLNAIFGVGNLPKGSDIGYVKIIHMIGIIGLCLVLRLYFNCIKLIKPMKSIDSDIFKFMIIFLLLLLIFNYKLLLLYSRGINDLFFLLIFIILKKIKMHENNKARLI